MRFVLIMSLLVAVCAAGLVPAIALINNFHQAAAVPWWQVVLGPLAAFCSPNADGYAGWLVAAAICLLAIVPEIRRDRFLWRITSTIGIFLWFLCGLAEVLAWA